MEITVTVNGVGRSYDVEPRLLLSDFLRHDLGLKGTHVGCEHGVCGACTVHLNGRAVRSCLVFAVQADGCDIGTVEGLTGADGEVLHPLQRAFVEHGGFQCGFCTPGFLMSVEPQLPAARDMSREELRALMGGCVCRCTGYGGIVDAVDEARKVGTNE